MAHDCLEFQLLLWYPLLAFLGTWTHMIHIQTSRHMHTYPFKWHLHIHIHICVYIHQPFIYTYTNNRVSVCLPCLEVVLFIFLTFLPFWLLHNMKRRIFFMSSFSSERLFCILDLGIRNGQTVFCSKINTIQLKWVLVSYRGMRKPTDTMNFFWGVI